MKERKKDRIEQASKQERVVSKTKEDICWIRKKIKTKIMERIKSKNIQSKKKKKNEGKKKQINKQESIYE